MADGPPMLWYAVAESPDGPVLCLINTGVPDDAASEQAWQNALRRGFTPRSMDWVPAVDMEARYPGLRANHFRVIDARMRAVDPDWPKEE